MEPFSVDVNNGVNNLTTAEVQTLILSGTGAVPLLLYHDGQIHLYLQPSKFDRRLGLLHTTSSNRMFITKGDLHNNQPVTANWLAGYFYQINAATLVPEVTSMQTR